MFVCLLFSIQVTLTASWESKISGQAVRKEMPTNVTEKTAELVTGPPWRQKSFPNCPLLEHRTNVQ